MNPGDLICGFRVSVPERLYLCLSVDRKAQEAECQLIANMSHVFVGTEKPETIRLDDPMFATIAWTGMTQSMVMYGRPYPHWVQAAMASHSSGHSGAAGPTMVPQTYTYPLGALIFGRTLDNNVWIVNTDKSNNVSLLWDGKGQRFTSSENERRNKITSPLLQQPLYRVCERIKAALGPSYAAMEMGLNDFPSWAQALISGTGQPAPQTTEGSVAAAAHDAITAMGVTSQTKVVAPPVKTRLDILRESCHHRFLHYTGIREVYEYCAECDTTRPVKK